MMVFDSIVIISINIFFMTEFYDIVAAFYEFLWNVQEINSSHKIDIKQNKKDHVKWRCMMF